MSQLLSNRWHIAALFAIVCFGLLLRAYDFNTVAVDSLTVEPDTRNKVELARKTAFDEKSPRYYMHPRLLINTSAVLLSLGAVAGYQGRIPTAKVMAAYTIVLSLATIVIVYFTAMFAFRRKSVALTGALIFATSPIAIVGTHYVKEDVPVMFACGMAMLMMLGLLRHRKPVYYIWSGLFIGIALGTKLAAVLLLPVAVIAHVLYVKDSRDWKKRLFCWQLFVGLILVPAGFFIFNHQNLVNFGEFWSATYDQLTYSRSGHWDDTVFDPWDYLWSFQLIHGLFPGLTPVVTVAGIAGAVVSIVRWRKNSCALLLTLWVVLFYLSIENSSAKPFPLFARYLYPMIPGLVCLASFALHQLFTQALKLPAGKLMGAAAAAGLLVWLCARSIVLVFGLTPDTRAQAAAWAEENLPKGTEIVNDGAFYSPRFSERFTVDTRNFCKKKWDLDEVDADYLVTSSFRYERYYANEKFVEVSKERADCFRQLLAGCKTVKQFAPRYEMATIGFHNPVITILDRKSCGTEDRNTG